MLFHLLFGLCIFAEFIDLVLHSLQASQKERRVPFLLD